MLDSLARDCEAYSFRLARRSKFSEEDSPILRILANLALELCLESCGLFFLGILQYYGEKKVTFLSITSAWNLG